MNRATENCGTTSKCLIYIEQSPQEKEGKNGTEKYLNKYWIKIPQNMI